MRCNRRVHLNQWDIQLRGEGDGLAVLVYPALVFGLIALGQVAALKKEVQQLKFEIEEMKKD